MSRLLTEAGRCSERCAEADTDISALILRSLQAIGRTDDTEVTAFTDGCPGLRSVLVDARITTPPILDWFHIAMRVQHAKQTASGLSADNPSRVQAKAVIVEEVERLRWRIWNGKAKDAKRSIDRIRKGYPCLQGPSRPSHEERADTQALARAARRRQISQRPEQLADQLRQAVPSGLHVGTSTTSECTANFLVNRRMNNTNGPMR
jgi:hypothetical protein